MADEVVLDTWSALNHKSTMQGSQRVIPDSGMARTWVSVEHRRRLNAYITLDAYLRNVARSWILSADRAERREYGDAALVRDLIRGAVLGDQFGFVIDDATAGAPPEPEPDATDTDVEGHAAEIAYWERATRQQHWLDRWAAIEQLDQKVIHAENNAVGLGDAVLVLAWSNKAGRVRVRGYDPGFYFPVYDDVDDDYPSRVHVAWEFEKIINGAASRFVRRITWEIIDDGVARTYPYPSSAAELDLEDPESSSPSGSMVDPAADSQSTSYCAMSDGVWKIADITSGMTVDDLSDGRAVWQENTDGETLFRFDLGVDFIPVIHIPNTVNLEEHFGESSLLRICQLLDDLQAADSDLASASALVGTPPLLVSGWEGQSKISTYGPGTVFGVADGDMKVLDTSSSLSSLTEHIEGLLNRLAVNRQIPESVLGRVDLTGQLAGVTLALSFGPFRQLIGEHRLARNEKYALLIKFLQRLGRVGGQLDAVFPGHIQYGSFLPSDVGQVVEMVTKMIQGDKPVISKATGLRWLTDVGVDVGDIEVELARVRAEDFSGAQALADATAQETAALDYLGLADSGVAPTPIPDEDLPQPPTPILE